MNRFVRLTLAAFLMMSCVLFAQETGTIRGIVTDSQTGEVLIGANVVLDGSTMGSATDIDGIYLISDVPAGTYTVIVSYIGYSDVVLSGITVTAGQATTADVSLDASGIGLNTVTVSASRRPEKTLEAPASVSVLSDLEVRADVSPSTVNALRNTASVDISQTGIDRREVVLRGFNNAFSGATFILTDYRQAAVPSLGVNIHSVMPNIGLDVDRVEVVRGPGSALYGPGVDAGVVHYFTKDPISNPGTAISLGGGERASYFGSFRHAGAVNENFGYKITAQYAQADDWELDPNDPIDALQLEGEQIARDYNYKKRNINATLMYRFNDRTHLTASGGWASLDGTVLTGVGTAQAKDFGYSYGQLRLQAGNLFAQSYINLNNAGDSFLYGDGAAVVDESIQINNQIQYDFGVSEKIDLIIGGDLDITRPDTKGTINGRNENNDNVTELGGYAQGLFRLTPKIDLTAAVRFDYNNIFEEVETSPRLAVVFKASPLHSFRATYNRAVTLPGNNSLNLDIVGQRQPLVPGFDLIVRGRGARSGFTFNSARSGGGLTASGLFPADGLWGAPVQYPNGAGVPTQNIPLAAAYGLTYGGLAATPVEELQALLAGQGIVLTPEQIGQFLTLLSPLPTEVSGNPFPIAVQGLASTALSGAPVDVDPLSNTITQTIEVGYKGLINNKLLVAVDGYYTEKNNFIGPLRNETPVGVFTSIDAELVPALDVAMQANPLLVGALALQGLTTADVAALLVGFASDNLNALPVAVVQPDGDGNAVPGELTFTYRNFGKVDFTGLDVSLQFLANERLSLFGNVSWVSDDFFDFMDLGVDDEALSVALNAPKFKAKGGFSYEIPRGINFGGSGRFMQGFPVESGPYVGGRPARGSIPADTDINPNMVGVEDFFLLDVNVGYDLYSVAPGLRVDLAVANVLDNMHREFIGAPQIGRMAMLRLGFSF